MNSKNERDPGYLDKYKNMTPKQREFLKIRVEGIVDTLEIGNKMYGEEVSDYCKRQRVRQTRKQVFNLYLGKKSEDEKRCKRDDEFEEYMKINDPERVNFKRENHENNEHENETIPRSRGHFSKTSSNIKVNNGILSATCKSINRGPLQADFNLNDHIANINGNLEWSQEGGFVDGCKNCRIDFVDVNGDGSNGDAYLVCQCRRPDSWNTTELNLDEKIDNTDGELVYYIR